jgi:hypothetical protein
LFYDLRSDPNTDPFPPSNQFAADFEAEDSVSIIDLPPEEEIRRQRHLVGQELDGPQALPCRLPQPGPGGFRGHLPD